MVEGRHNARENIYEFGLNVLGYERLWATYHEPLLNFVADNDPALLIAPRGTLKTICVGVIYPLWLLINELPLEPKLRHLPVVKTRIIIASDVESHSAQCVASIKRHLKDPDSRLRQLFPELRVGESPGNPSMLYIDRASFGDVKEPTVRGIGTKTEVTGMHCTHFIGDDLVNHNTVKSGTMEGVIQWWEEAIATQDLGTQRILLGTIYDGDDLLMSRKAANHRLAPEDQYQIWHYGLFGEPGRDCIVDDEVDETMACITPNIYPPTRIRKIRSELMLRRPEEWYTQFLSDATASLTGTLDRSALNIRPGHCLPEQAKDMGCVMAVDPSTGLRRGDPSGIVILGRELEDGMVVLPFAQEITLKEDDLIDYIFGKAAIFGVQQMVVETIGQAVSIQTRIADWQRRNNNHIPVSYPKGSAYNTSKVARIIEANKRVQVEGLGIWEGSRDFLRQWNSWHSKAKSDHMVDAFSRGLELLPPLYEMRGRSKVVIENVPEPPADRQSHIANGMVAISPEEDALDEYDREWRLAANESQGTWPFFEEQAC